MLDNKRSEAKIRGTDQRDRSEGQVFDLSPSHPRGHSPKARLCPLSVYRVTMDLIEISKKSQNYLVMTQRAYAPLCHGSLDSFTNKAIDSGVSDGS